MLIQLPPKATEPLEISQHLARGTQVLSCEGLIHLDEQVSRTQDLCDVMTLLSQSRTRVDTAKLGSNGAVLQIYDGTGDIDQSVDIAEQAQELLTTVRNSGVQCVGNERAVSFQWDTTEDNTTINISISQ